MAKRSLFFSGQIRWLAWTSSGWMPLVHASRDRKIVGQNSVNKCRIEVEECEKESGGATGCGVGLNAICCLSEVRSPNFERS